MRFGRVMRAVLHPTPKNFAFALVAALVVVAVMPSQRASANDALALQTKMPRSDQTLLRPWSVKRQATVDATAFFTRLAQSSIVLLGEVHDNPLHHELRARLVKEIVKRREASGKNTTKVAAVFEHVTTDLQHEIDAAISSKDATDKERLDAFFTAAKWRARGWPDADSFAPLIDVVLKAGLPVYAGDVDRKSVRAVAKPGGDKRLPADAQRLKLDLPLAAEQQAASVAQIEASHCGILPKSAFEPMARAQRLRDATLADVTLRAAEEHGAAMLFTGNGHVREDRGVPWYLAARGVPDFVTVMFKEIPVVDAKTTGSAPVFAASSADYVIWTAPKERPDPCQKMREKYGKTKH